MERAAHWWEEGEFSLPAAESSALLGQQIRWMLATFGCMGLVCWLGGGVAHPVAVGLSVGAGMVAARPRPLHTVFARGLGVAAITWFLSGFLGWFSAWTAAGLVAGAMVGRGWLGRLEGMLVAGICMVLVPWMWSNSLSLVPGADWLFLGMMALATPMTLVPAALQFTPFARVPSPSRIAATLQAQYRQPCNRAWQLDQEMNAPDRTMREGLAEVGVWIYRLAETLQTLDQDIGRINPLEIHARHDTLLAEAAASDDAFIRERHQGTARHLQRLLEHRESLVRERARTSSLQEYALAYLEEARAGIAVARVLPGERTPEQLGVVLDKLRNHAAEGGARRQAARELESVRA